MKKMQTLVFVFIYIFATFSMVVLTILFKLYDLMEKKTKKVGWIPTWLQEYEKEADDDVT